MHVLLNSRHHSLNLVPPVRTSSLRWNIAANYFGQTWTAAMNIAFIPVYISYLGMDAFGLIGFHAALHSWLSFAGNILGPVANRETARFSADPLGNKDIWNRLRSLEWIGLGSTIVVSAMVAALSTVIARFWLHSKTLELETIATSIALMGPIIGLRVLETYYQGAIAGLQRQVLLNSTVAFLATLRSLGTIGVLAWMSPRIEYYFSWQLFCSIISLVTLRLATYRMMPKPLSRPRPSIKALEPIRNFSAGMLISTLLALLLTHADKLLLSRLLNLREFGYYMLANTLASGLLFLMAPVAQAYYPRLSQLAACKDEPQLTRQYHNGSKLVTLSVGPMCLLMSIFSQQILFAWTGDNDLAGQTASLLTLLAVGNGLHTLMHMPYMLQLANGWSGLSARINAVACLVVLPAILYFVPHYGASAAAAIWLTLNAGYVTLGISLMHTRLLRNEQLLWYSRDIIVPLLSILIGATSIRAAYPENLSRPMSVLTLICTALILYAIAAAHYLPSTLRNQTRYGPN